MTLTQVTKAGLHTIALDHVFTIGASGSDHYTFQGEGLNGTVNDPTLYLTRGKTYRFENGSGGHPIRIQSTSGASGTAYNTGVTNNAGSGTVIVEVQHDAPDVLYYQCTSHANMNGVLYIAGALADGGVTTAKLASSSVTNVKIAAGNVDNTALGTNSVSTVKIQDDAVTNAKLADNSVNSNNYVDGSINSAHINNNAVTTAEIADNAITSGKIADDAVTGAKIADDAVDTAQIANNAVVTAQIANSQITTAKIADNAVTAAKLATNSVEGGKLTDSSVTNAKVHPSAAIAKSKIENFVGGNANNRVITGTDTTNLLNGESGLVFDGSNARLGVNTSSPSTTLSVINDSNTEGFNVKHSNLSQGIGIGYDTIKSTGSSTNVPLTLHSKGTGSLKLNCQAGNTVAEVVGTSRNFKVHGNHAGWSTVNMDDQNYGWRTHVRRVNNGGNSVTTHNIARIKRTNWGWGYYELRIYSTYYYGSYVSIGYIMGHGNGGDSYSIKRKKEIYTDNSSIGWGSEITKGSASSSSPGQTAAHYFDLKITLPNYTYSTVEFIAYSSYKLSDSEMTNTLDCYRLFTP